MFPATETAQWAVYQSGVTNAHGVPVDAWAEPVEIGIIGFDPGGLREPQEPGTDRIVATPTIYTPPGVVLGSRDRITVRGVLYEVDGGTQEWRHPNGWTPGNATALKAVTG